MLKAGVNGEVATHAFLVGVELEGKPNVESIMQRLADAISFMDGIGHIEVEHLGAVEMMEELVGPDDPEVGLPGALKGMNES